MLDFLGSVCVPFFRQIFLDVINIFILLNYKNTFRTTLRTFFPLREYIVVAKNMDSGIKVPEFKFHLFHLHCDLGKLHFSVPHFLHL